MAKSNNNHIRLLELYDDQIYLVLSMSLPASLCKNALLNFFSTNFYLSN